MPELITIPISNFELSIAYKRPVLGLWFDRTRIVQRMFDAFEPWQLTVDDFEGITTGKLSEQGVKFKVPVQRITFFFGPGSQKKQRRGQMLTKLFASLLPLSMY
jgi:hypothetical protein